MKKIIIGILVLALISVGAWAAMHKWASPIKQNPTAKTYIDPGQRFTLLYPAHWTASGPEGNVAEPPTAWSVVTQTLGMVSAKVSVPKELYPNTNFSEAWLTVGWSNNSTAINTCTINTQQEGMDVQDAVIDGTLFKKFTTSDAGAGNLYDTIAYHALLDGDCWAIEYTIHSTNIYNYPPEAGIVEFDKSDLMMTLDEVAHSFDFLVNSD